MDTQKKAATIEPSLATTLLPDHNAHSVLQVPLLLTEVGRGNLFQKSQVEEGRAGGDWSWLSIDLKL
jgi:hypothetical protein